MNRPGPVGVTMILAFAFVAAIELRTVLAMVGIAVPVVPYAVATAGLIGAVLAALYFLPEDDRGNPTRA